MDSSCLGGDHEFDEYLRRCRHQFDKVRIVLEHQSIEVWDVIAMPTECRSCFYE
ncbi:hypothetical protein J3R82DRAFT_2147 [Butyriboletus roseoflavus]|nr:hypothetical protein J3R82DRAFT_2147 [Butyriboletus roseoflavus]